MQDVEDFTFYISTKKIFYNLLIINYLRFLLLQKSQRIGPIYYYKNLTLNLFHTITKISLTDASPQMLVNNS
jgi:hypothetical protein